MSGSGKNTVGEEVARKLDMRTVEYTFKDYARKKESMLKKNQKYTYQFLTVFCLRYLIQFIYIYDRIHTFSIP
jgi:hypothetical protein